MTPLKSILDNLDGLDEAFHGLYEKDGDKFVLRLDSNSVREHPHVLSLKNALDRTQNELKEAKSSLNASKGRLENVPEDFDAALYSRLVAEEKSRKENPEQPDRQLASQRDMYEERIQRAANKHQKELADLNQEIVAKQVSLDARDKDQALDQAISTVGIKREFVPAVRALMRGQVQIDPNDMQDGRPVPFLETDMGRQTVAQYMQNWVQSDAGKVYVEAATGGDAGGSGERIAPGTENPWRTDGGRRPNLTKQQDLLSKNPALARRLAAQAGVTLAA